MKHLKDKIRNIPNFPKQGINFKDITPLLDDPNSLNEVTDALYKRYKGMNITKIVGVDARGFIFGSILAHLLHVGFTPARKKGKLPFDTINVNFTCEYGSAEMEMHKDALKEGDRVVIIDDLLATGGTAMAAVQLVRQLGAEVVECTFVIGLTDLPGFKLLSDNKVDVFTLMNFDGE